MAPVITNIQNIVFPFLYLSSGYLALLIGYWNDFEKFRALRGTDIVILTFIIGSFELLSIAFYIGIPDQFTGAVFGVYLAILLIFTFLSGLVIKTLRKIL